VSFAYGVRPPIFNCLNFRVALGQKVALVGSSGAGKSTIAKLVARLYDVNTGAIRINGVDVREIELESLRKTVCYVMQESMLFDLTLEENLLLGNRHADTSQIFRALEIAELVGLLERLPHGWNTKIGPHGNLLSGGERQRLVLARAVLQQPTIMVLDESTSAVDLPTERRILSNLACELPDTTMLFISHRLASLNWVDRIFVVNQGAVEEQGTHTQLLYAQGIYSRLYHIYGRIS
jgi:ATP-binding cassette subfamily B protein